MGIIDLTRMAFSKKYRKHIRHLKNIKSLSNEQIESELGLILYNMCFEYAHDFVKEALNRSDSPFKNLNIYNFFNEILILTFWVVEKAIGKDKKLMDEIHKNYFNTNKQENKLHTKEISYLLNRYKTYYDSWDDITGHQDVFGTKVAENIFGNIKEYRPDISFWLIHYADYTMKKFSDYKKTCSKVGIEL